MLAIDNHFSTFYDEDSPNEILMTYWGRGHGGASKSGFKDLGDYVSRVKYNTITMAAELSGEYDDFRDYFRAADKSGSYRVWNDDDAPEYFTPKYLEGYVGKWGAALDGRDDIAIGYNQDPEITSAAIRETLWAVEIGRVSAYIMRAYMPEMASNDAYIAKYGSSTDKDGLIDAFNELSAAFIKPDVKAVMAESSMFLSLTEKQKAGYVFMDLDSRYSMLFESSDNYDQYISEHQHYTELRYATSNMGSDAGYVVDTGEPAPKLVEIGSNLSSTDSEVLADFNRLIDEQSKSYIRPNVNDDIDPLVRLYEGVLDRTPERDGFTAWLSYLKKDVMSLEQIAFEFANSPEFLGNEGSADAETVIGAMYRNVLDREPDQSGLDAWIGAYNDGWSLGRIVLGFTESEEYIESMKYQVAADRVNIYGANLNDLVKDANSLGFEQWELTPIEVSSDQNYWLYE